MQMKWVLWKWEEESEQWKEYQRKKKDDGERKSKVRPISFQAMVGETGEQKS